MKRIFGFDLGIASIGWAAIEIGKEYFDPETGEITEGKILDAGVRAFPVAENPKDGSSLATPRRAQRLARRLCRRKARRMQGIKSLFLDKGLVSSLEELNQIYANQEGGDVWGLRVKALSEQLTSHELVRVLTHLAKHRGFKSYRKSEGTTDKETGKVLQAINENRKYLKDTSRTLAQIIVEKAGETGKKRNYSDKQTKEIFYYNSIPREEIERETELIRQKQELFTDDLYKDFTRIAFRFRPIGSVEEMVGYCAFEKGEKRAPKEAPSSEFFVALTKINHLMIYENNEKKPLSPEERLEVLNLLKTTQTVKYKTLSKKIFKDRDVYFAGLDYTKSTKKTKTGEIKEVDPEDTKFYEMKGYHKLKLALKTVDSEDLMENIPLMDQVVQILTYYKNDKDIGEALSKLNLTGPQIEVLKDISCDKFLHLSFKALYKILPFLEQGDNYYKACEQAGYDPMDSGDALVPKSTELKVIPFDKQTKNPVVNRTVAQFRKVCNALIRKYGLPDQINIETGRELKKSYEERKKIKAKQEENQQEREKAKEELKKLTLADNSKNVLKYRLYQEQDGKCIYSGTVIDIKRLEEDGYVEVDHILPYSRSLDDSYVNKVLCLSQENQRKGNRTPFEYIPKDKWEEFQGRVNAMKALNRHKKDKLLLENFSGKEEEFRKRNANDNSYISRYVKQYIEDGLDIPKNKIQSRPGSLTDYLRYCWGLKKDRSESDKHHAQDAIVVACATQEMVTYLSTVSGLIENKWKLGAEKGQAWYKALKHKIPECWSGFHDEVGRILENIFVSRPPRKKARGEIHDATIYTLNPAHKNYDAQKIKSGFLVRGGIAGNGAMFRCDFYNVSGYYKVVPVYISDLFAKEPFQHFFQPYEYERDEKGQDKVDSQGNKIRIGALEKDFIFSLYKDDYLKIKTKEMIYEGYFSQYNAQSGQIYLSSNDNSNIFKVRDKKEESGYRLSNEKKISISTCLSIQKYQIGVLGEKIVVKKENQRFSNKKKGK